MPPAAAAADSAAAAADVAAAQLAHEVAAMAGPVAAAIAAIDPAAVAAAPVQPSAFFTKAIIQPLLLKLGFRGFLSNRILAQQTNIVKQTIEKPPKVDATLEAFVCIGKRLHHFL